MKQIADLHIHSRYSMATSKDGTPEMLDLAKEHHIAVLASCSRMYEACGKLYASGLGNEACANG